MNDHDNRREVEKPKRLKKGEDRIDLAGDGSFQPMAFLEHNADGGWHVWLSLDPSRSFEFIIGGGESTIVALGEAMGTLQRAADQMHDYIVYGRHVPSRPARPHDQHCGSCDAEEFAAVQYGTMHQI